MTTVIIIHGWDFTPEHNWYPWLSEKLSERNFDVIVPEMPNSAEPRIEVWIAKLGEVMDEHLNEEIILVGHSIGTQTIMRYLASAKQSVKGIVFVGGWVTLDQELLEKEGEEIQSIAKPWLETPINFEAVIQCAPHRIVFLSDNDYYVPLDENKKIFKENLQAEVIVESTKGHYTYQDGVTELPSVLEAVLSIQKD